MIATEILAILGVCRFWGLLSQVVEEEFGLFLGMSKNASYLCIRIKKQSVVFELVFFHTEFLVSCLLFRFWFIGL